MAVLVISYSRADQPQVRGIVSLLRGAMRGMVEQAVFWDGQLEPGDVWFEEIRRHIDAAPQLFVFWCAHSSASAEVRREFLYAFERQKNVIPVLLDDTPLTAELARIHGIDLRGVVRHGEPAATVSDVPSSFATPRARMLVAGVALLLSLAWLTLRWPGRGPEGDLPVRPVPPAIAVLNNPTNGDELDSETLNGIDDVMTGYQPGRTRVVINEGSAPGADRAVVLARAYIRQRFEADALVAEPTPGITLPLQATVTIETDTPPPSPSPPLLGWLTLLLAIALLWLSWRAWAPRRSKTERYIVTEFAKHLQ